MSSCFFKLKVTAFYQNLYLMFCKVHCLKFADTSRCFSRNSARERILRSSIMYATLSHSLISIVHESTLPTNFIAICSLMGYNAFLCVSICFKAFDVARCDALSFYAFLSYYIARFKSKKKKTLSSRIHDKSINFMHLRCTC